MKSLILFGFATAAQLLPYVAVAGNRSGTVTEQFLKLPTSARVVGLGGAQVAVAEGVSSLSYNPAGVLSITNYGFAATYTKWFADIQHSFIGVAMNIEDVGVVGVSVTMLATDDMEVTTPALPDGTGEFFRASDYAFGLSFARKISGDFSVGITAKYIKSYLYNTVVGASTFAFDIGTLYDIPVLRTRLGMSLNNLGGDVTFINEPYSLPTALRFGAQVTVFEEADHKVQTTFQIARPNDADEQYNAGIEYLVYETVALRAGYKFAYDAENITAGLGVKLSALGLQGQLDYGFNNFRWLPGTHSFSLELQF